MGGGPKAERNVYLSSIDFDADSERFEPAAFVPGGRNLAITSRAVGLPGPFWLRDFFELKDLLIRC